MAAELIVRLTLEQVALTERIHFAIVHLGRDEALRNACAWPVEHVLSKARERRLGQERHPTDVGLGHACHKVVESAGIQGHIAICEQQVITLGHVSTLRHRPVLALPVHLASLLAGHRHEPRVFPRLLHPLELSPRLVLRTVVHHNELDVRTVRAVQSALHDLRDAITLVVGGKDHRQHLIALQPISFADLGRVGRERHGHESDDLDDNVEQSKSNHEVGETQGGRWHVFV
mmetsp:Transcript_32942/g.56353  ORF Transcript_32942/g.56353 Transcript_32942/m.56353 type:complete len:231 (-) Transcript_32942:193-885(-)